MNELYACDPVAIKSSSELKMLLSHFNPFVGRYVIECPYYDNWRKMVIDQFSQSGELEKKRVSYLIHKAKEKSTFYRPKSAHWNDSKVWLENALSNEIPLSRIVTEDGTQETTGIFDLNLPSTAGERILGNLQEFARVTEVLLHMSQEVYFIDPYLYFDKTNVKLVVEKLVEILSSSKCKKATFICHVPKDSKSVDEVKKSAEYFLRKLRRDYQAITFKYLMLNDAASHIKMHKRYLLSIKGAVELDKGFQLETNKGSRVEVNPVNETIHDELIKIYHEMQHEMKIEFEF